MQNAPIPPPTGQVGKFARPELDVRPLAGAQRDLLKWFLINVVVYIGGRILSGALGDSAIGSIITLVSVVALLALSVLQAMAGYRIAVELRSPSPALVAIGMFVPCVSLFVLLSLNGKATKTLQAAGLRVGFMGVSKDDFDALPGA